MVGEEGKLPSTQPRACHPSWAPSRPFLDGSVGSPGPWQWVEARGDEVACLGKSREFGVPAGVRGRKRQERFFPTLLPEVCMYVIVKVQQLASEVIRVLHFTGGLSEGVTCGLAQRGQADFFLSHTAKLLWRRKRGKCLGPGASAAQPAAACIPLITVALSFRSKQVLTCSEDSNRRADRHRVISLLCGI